MASTNRFEVILKGKGGHISLPAKCIDPVRMAVDFINSLNSALEERLDKKNMSMEWAGSGRCSV